MSDPTPQAPPDREAAPAARVEGPTPGTIAALPAGGSAWCDPAALSRVGDRLHLDESAGCGPVHDQARRLRVLRREDGYALDFGLCYESDPPPAPEGSGSIPNVVVTTGLPGPDNS